ncbi:MAG: peptide chain release factor N(5)-glutamine methyltransferase [Methylacidiphilales bacterium]|nr:peptide chain release factor N(5)-glutamine methyltransferase [Candidatus Methylacidiphilales bacterium]MDW8349715.1 peptide chain release factor N(5)-glutamine methyltransferase [Verrucomicrobiae bacterium]
MSVPHKPTLASLIQEGAERLSSVQGIENPRLEAETLAAHILGISRMTLLAQLCHLAISDSDQERFLQFIEKRAAGEPIAYITQQAQFLHHTLYVDPAVLIPRPDTELLFETAASLFDPNQGSWLDVGTGSGAIAIAAADRFPNAKIYATDISAAALSVAHRNACNYPQITFFQADLLQGLPLTEWKPYLVTANLPYLPSEDLSRLAPHVQREPRLALDGGHDGLEIIRRFISQASTVAIPVLALEIGDGQDEPVLALMQTHNYQPIHRLSFLVGPTRVITAAHSSSISIHG